MNMKELLRETKPKNFEEMSSDDRMYLIYDNMPELVNDYTKKGHKLRAEVDELFERMTNKKFLKALQKMVKNKMEIDPGMALIITDFLEKKYPQLAEDDADMIEGYTKLISKILKKRVKDMVKATKSGKGDEQAEYLFQELLTTVPEPTSVSHPRFVGIYVNRIANKLYRLAKHNPQNDDVVFGLPDTKTTSRMFAELFGKNMLNDVAIALLLERSERARSFTADQKATWDGLTVFALDQLESNKKKDLVVLMEHYDKRRARNKELGRDGSRIDLDKLSAEDYPKLVKVISKLKKEVEEESSED